MDNPRGYQLHFSKGDTVLRNIEGRTQKFKKIFSVIRDFRPEINRLNCLDLGCSNGIITSLLGEKFAFAIGVDIDQEAVSWAQKHYASSKNGFLIGDALSLPFKDESFDVIICNHIYEHVPDAKKLMDEVYRVLKRDGFCYFSAGNRYMIVEGHYGLPFLSWLPKPIAHLYLRITGKGKFYYENHLSLRGLKRLVQKFQIWDYTLSVIQNPEKYFATDLLNTKDRWYGWIRLWAQYLYRWIPTYVWILTKK